MAKTYNSPNPKRIKLINELKDFINKNKNYKIWKKVCKELEKVRKNRRVVNLWKINKYTKDNDIVIVPGKVLGDGTVNHNITVACFEASSKVKELAKNSKNLNLISIEELLKQNPTGSNVKIIC